MNNNTPTTTKRTPGVSCPACGSARDSRQVTGETSLFVCGACGALHGRTYLGQSYAYVLPYLTSSVEGVEEAPFDIQTLGSAGLGRRHGFYQPSTKLMVQVG